MFTLVVALGSAIAGSLLTALVLVREKDAPTDRPTRLPEGRLSDDLEGRLEELRRQLARDSDPRDEHLFTDLRELLRQTLPREAWPELLPLTSRTELRNDIGRLFAATVALLERQYGLLQSARSVREQNARVPLLRERERILDEIRGSVEQLGAVVAWIHELKREESNHSARIREELGRNLELAARVKSRMSDLDNELRATLERDPSLAKSVE
ncbi:MAG: hypothetical protein AAFQ77_01465 [Myxococcota bacterium]